MDRFGRFPQRNKVLGRENTPEEEEWLNNLPDKFKWWSIHRVLMNCTPNLVIHFKKMYQSARNFNIWFPWFSFPSFLFWSTEGLICSNLFAEPFYSGFSLHVKQSFHHEERLRDGMRIEDEIFNCRGIKFWNFQVWLGFNLVNSISGIQNVFGLDLF